VIAGDRDNDDDDADGEEADGVLIKSSLRGYVRGWNAMPSSD
jgi:hypothetical protein